jgi:hypothetical protein
MVRVRLLDEDVSAQLDRGQGGDGVEVIGRPDGDRVDVLLLLEHDSEVLVARDVGILGKGSGRALPVNVAEGDDVLRAHLAQTPGAGRPGGGGRTEPPVTWPITYTFGTVRYRSMSLL